jgi:hypothetical protein
VEQTLLRPEYFGQYGRIHKLVVNTVPQGGGVPGVQPSASAYITFYNPEDARACIRSCDGFILEGRQLKTNYGTTKYCNSFLRNLPCNNHDCLYLHDYGNPDDSFTKDEIQSKTLLASPLQPGIPTLVGNGGPSGTGKRCQQPFLPPPVFETPEFSRQRSNGPPPPPPPPSLVAVKPGAGATTPALRAAASGKPGQKGGSVTDHLASVRMGHVAGTPWASRGGGVPGIGAEASGGGHKGAIGTITDPGGRPGVTAANGGGEAWPSLGEAVATVSSPIRANKSSAGKKGGAGDAGEGSAQQKSQQAQAQMKARQEAHMRAQAAMKNRPTGEGQAAAEPRESPHPSPTPSQPAAASSSRVRQRQKQKQSPQQVPPSAASRADGGGKEVGGDSASSTGKGGSGKGQQPARPPRHSPSGSILEGQQPKSPELLSLSATAQSPVAPARGGSSMFSTDMFRGMGGVAPDRANLPPPPPGLLPSPAISAQARGSPGQAGAAASEVKSPPTPDFFSDSRGSTGAPGGNRLDAVIPSELFCPPMGSNSADVWGTGNNFSGAFGSALFPSSASPGRTGGDFSTGADLTVDPFASRGTNALAQLLGVTLPPVDSHSSLASQLRQPGGPKEAEPRQQRHHPHQQQQKHHHHNHHPQPKSAPHARYAEESKQESQQPQGIQHGMALLHKLLPGVTLSYGGAGADGAPSSNPGERLIAPAHLKPGADQARAQGSQAAVSVTTSPAPSPSPFGSADSPFGSSLLWSMGSAPAPQSGTGQSTTASHSYNGW